MNQIELNLAELDSKEFIHFEGGDWLRGIFPTAFAYELATNWDAIKAGASDSWDGIYNNRFF